MPLTKDDHQILTIG